MSHVISIVCFSEGERHEFEEKILEMLGLDAVPQPVSIPGDKSLSAYMLDLYHTVEPNFDPTTPGYDDLFGSVTCLFNTAHLLMMKLFMFPYETVHTVFTSGA